VYWKLRARGNYGPPPGLPNLPALFAYLLGPAAIALLLMPDCRRDRFVVFSAWQSIIFSVTAYLATVVGPWLGLERPIYWVLWMTAATLYWIFLMKQAYQNRFYLIPGLGQLAARRAGFNEGQLSDLSAGETR
jgi:uncharacterized membrane protein